MIDNLLEFGVAINFFGNYRTEAEKMSNWASGFASRMTDIGTIVSSIGIGALVANFGSNIYKAGMQMEGAYAGLKSILGSQEKVLEALAWAQKKGLETPFTTTEVLSALTTLTTSGFAITKDLRERSFDAFSDLASAFPDRIGDISNAAQMVAKASMGNWEHLADNIGIRANNIKQISQQILSQKLDTSGLKATMGDLEKYFTIVTKGTKGTTEYKDALVTILGTVFKGSNAAKFDTLSGSLSNFTDISERFYQKIAGFSQAEGSFFNAIKNTFKDTIYGRLTKEYKEFQGLAADGSPITKQVSALDKLNRIAERIGGVFTAMWASLDSASAGVTDKLIGYINKVDAFFSDYQNKVAPFILFLYLVKLQVIDFFKGLADGFKATFGFYWKFAGFIVDMYTEFFNLFSSENTSRIYSVGAAIGYLVGTVAGLKVVSMVIGPLKTLFGVLQVSFDFLKTSITWFGVATKEGGLIFRGLAMLRTGFSALIPVIRGVSVALTANPIGVIVMAIAAALFLVWTYWDEIKGAIDGLSPSVVKLAAVFLPVVGIPLLLIRNWEKFSVGFINLWEGVKGFMAGTWTYLKLGFQMYGDAIVARWNKIMGLFGRFKEFMKNNFAPVFSVFEDVGKALDKWLIQPLMQVWDYVSKIWDKMGGSIMWLFEKGTDMYKGAGQGFEEGARKAQEDYDAKSGRQGSVTPPVGGDSQGLFKTISTPTFGPVAPGNTTNDNRTGYNIQSLNLNIKAAPGFSVDDFKAELERELRTSVG